MLVHVTYKRRLYDCACCIQRVLYLSLTREPWYRGVKRYKLRLVTDIYLTNCFLVLFAFIR